MAKEKEMGMSREMSSSTVVEDISTCKPTK